MRRDRRAARPMLEQVEGRLLLSTTRTLAGVGVPHAKNPIPVAIPPQTVIQGLQPTAAELRRQQFRAVFSGPYLQGPPRFVDQTTQSFIRGFGTASVFLHGNLQLQTATFATPPQNVTPIPGQYVEFQDLVPNAIQYGQATLIDKNINDSGTFLVDLAGNASGMDSLGRPTHLTYVVIPSANSGGFNGGGFSLSNGSGTVDIHYSTTKGGSHGAHAAGQATVVFNGTLFIPGSTNPARNYTLQTSHHKSIY